MRINETLKTGVAGILSILVASTTAYADSVKVAYSSWCPHVCTDQDENLVPESPGLAIEAVREAFASQGIETVFVALPFSRQLADVSAGEQDALMQIKKAPDRNYVWPKTPMGADQQCFVVAKSNDWIYQGKKSLEDISIGAIAGYKYGELSDYMSDPANKVEFLSGDKTDVRNLEKVGLGRIDAFLENRDILAHLIKQRGGEDTFKFAGCLEPIDLFLAFSPVLDSSQGYADALDRGVTTLRSNGRLKELLDSYGLSDWQ